MKKILLSIPEDPHPGNSRFTPWTDLTTTCNQSIYHPMHRYYALSTYLRGRFGVRVQKVPLDAGFTCPNRDGTLSRSGCVFCNPEGSGSGMSKQKLSLSQQYTFWTEKFARKRNAKLFLAYLQSYSNTYAPMPRFREVISELSGLEHLAGLCLGTRPDCLEPEKLACLADQAVPEIWLELGLQSSSDATLQRINRGHDAACFARAVEAAHRLGLKVCAHVMAGLPGEGQKEFLDTIDFVSNLPVAGIKLHNLYVCRGTVLASWWRQGNVHLLERAEYIDLVLAALPRLRPDMVIHRLNADPAPGELLAPQWAGHKGNVLRAMAAAIEDADIWQGQSTTPHIPAWYDPAGEHPGVMA